MCSTPVTSLENITGLQSLEDRSDIKVLTRAARQSQIFLAGGDFDVLVGTLNTKIKTKKLCKIGNNWSRAPKVDNFQKYPKMSFFL